MTVRKNRPKRVVKEFLKKNKKLIARDPDGKEGSGKFQMDPWMKMTHPPAESAIIDETIIEDSV